MKKPAQVRLGGLFFVRVRVPAARDSSDARPQGVHARMTLMAPRIPQLDTWRVIPAQAGIHLASHAIKGMDSRLRGNDAVTRRKV
jgi:hypothetical protein